MSSNLINSAALVKDVRFNDLVRAAIVERALAAPNNRLSRSMVRDSTYLLPMFVSVAADDPVISADGWQDKPDIEKQDDVRNTLSQLWSVLGAAVPNLRPESARIPVLEVDPPVTSEVSIWIASGGNLRVRGDDETVREYPVVV